MTTAYVYDPRYLDHTSRRGEHPERPMRLTAIMDVLTQHGVLDRMTQIPAEEVTDNDLLRVHLKSHVNKLREVCASGGGLLDADTYVAPASYAVARLAAGGCVAVVDAVLDGLADNGFAYIRPPGHHAFADRSEGFCLFNNVAIAARHAQARDYEKVAIVDFDVHHGNGTQGIFYYDPSVLYISTHQWPLYPGTGHWRETGASEGRGYNVNVTLPPGAGDLSTALAWEYVIGPALTRFGPDLLLISAGFDAHWRDPLAMLQVSVPGFAQLTHNLVQFANTACQGRVVTVLEGGYDLDALAYGALAVTRTLLGDPTLTDPLGLSTWPEEDSESLIKGIAHLHGL